MMLGKRGVLGMRVFIVLPALCSLGRNADFV